MIKKFRNQENYEIPKPMGLYITSLSQINAAC